VGRPALLDSASILSYFGVSQIRGPPRVSRFTFVTSLADVIGNTGIACGNYKISRKHKEFPWVSTKKRWSSTWVKTNGQWKLGFYHFELIEAWR